MRFRSWTAATILFLLPATAAAADLADLQAKGVLRVVVAADEAPETFAVTSDGEPGFERELIEGFARLHGLRVEPVTAAGYGDRIPLLQRGEGDLVVAIFDTPDRRQLVDFTVEVMPTHTVVVTMDPRPPVTSLADLKAARVGVIKGAKPADEAVKAGLPASSLQGFERRDQLVAALRSNAVAAAILPMSEVALAARRDPGLRAGITVGSPGKVAWAVRQEDDVLEAALNEYIANVRRGSTWSRLVVKYFGDQTLAVLGRQ
jgi:ABC-type amino acid transport substrate-binding protein